MNFKDLLGKFTSIFGGKSKFENSQVAAGQRMTSTGTQIPLSPVSASNNKFLSLIFLSLLALMTADLIALKSRLYMIPTGQPPARKVGFEQAVYKPRLLYDDILTRNIFNSDGIIPDTMLAQNGVPDISGPAKESTLELSLVGTIVHANPGKSVATIAFKNDPEKILPYIPNDEIEGLATLLKVDRKRVYVRNMQSGAIEYIQIKDEPGITFQKKSAAKQDGLIQTEGENSFGIARNDLESQMSNLPELLTQARAVAHNTNGRIDGFTITEIVKGSIYEKLGLKDGDTLKEVDGEKLDSAAKGMELYNGLRSKNQIRMVVDRNGKPMTITYNIH